MNEELIAEALRALLYTSGGEIADLPERLADALSAAEARALEAEQWRDAMINKNYDLQEALEASIANYGSITRERHDALARAEAAEARAVEAHQQYVDANEARLDAERQLAAAREALKWVKQVYPEPLPNGGVYVEMTKEEFEAMRAALSDAPAPVSGP